MTTMRLIAIEPDPTSPMPDIEAYMALAEALHIEDEQCEEVPFEDCLVRESDIGIAVRVLVAVRKSGDWRLVREPIAATRLGL